MTSFTSYFGNILLGMYVQWGAEGSTDTVDATSVLTATITLNLYAAADQLDSSTLTDADVMYFYLLWQNPYDIFDQDDTSKQPIPNSMVPFDGLVSNLVFTVGAQDMSDSTTNQKTLEVLAPSATAIQAMTDVYCLSTITEGIYDAAACSPDTTDLSPKADNASGHNSNAWTPDEADADDYCIEYWDTATLVTGPVVNYTKKCVRIQIGGKKPFTSLDTKALIDAAGVPAETNTYDFDLGFRSYSVSAGWIIPSSGSAAEATDVPGVIDFDAITVDFATFQSDVVKYEGSIYGMAIAGTSLFAAIFSMSF